MEFVERYAELTKEKNEGKLAAEAWCGELEKHSKRVKEDLGQEWGEKMDLSIELSGVKKGLSLLQGCVKNPSRERHIRKRDGYVFLFDEEADYWKRRLDTGEEELIKEKNDMLTKMLQPNSANVRQTERRVREEVEKEKRIVAGKGKGVQWSPPKVQAPTAEVQTEVGIEALEQAIEKKEEEPERAQDSMPTRVTLPAAQEDTEMKDKPASSDGYIYMKTCPDVRMRRKTRPWWHPLQLPKNRLPNVRQ